MPTDTRFAALLTEGHRLITENQTQPWHPISRRFAMHIFFEGMINGYENRSSLTGLVSSSPNGETMRAVYQAGVKLGEQIHNEEQATPTPAVMPAAWPAIDLPSPEQRESERKTAEEALGENLVDVLVVTDTEAGKKMEPGYMKVIFNSFCDWENQPLTFCNAGPIVGDTLYNTWSDSKGRFVLIPTSQGSKS